MNALCQYGQTGWCRGFSVTYTQVYVFIPSLGKTLKSKIFMSATLRLGLVLSDYYVNLAQKSTAEIYNTFYLLIKITQTSCVYLSLSV